MGTSRAPAAVDALLTSLTTAPSLTGTPIYDGPVVPGTFADCVFVGYDGDPHGEHRSLTTDQQWAGLGAKKRTETITIHCAIVTRNTAEIAKPARDRAFALLAVVENVLRADPSMGQTPTPFIAAVTSPEMWWDWTDGLGIQARLTFTVTIETRI